MKISPLVLGILTAIFGSGCLLMGAYAFQYLGGLQPCHMCSWQRYAHWTIFALGCVGLWTLNRKADNTTRWLIRLSLAGALASCSLAVWHAGVEYHWWLGPEGCTAQAFTGSVADISKHFVLAPVVLCDVAQWQLFGISMAGYNFLASFLMALIFGYCLRSATHDDRTASSPARRHTDAA
jgi:disulfide bond formation protein DsbB